MPAPASESPKESAITRFLIAPLTFVSFLVSLALIDSQNAFRRADPSGRPPSFLHRILYRDSRQPYAYVTSPYKDGGKSGSPSSRSEKEPWHWNTKQRKMMKLEISDAFEIRKWVLAGLLACGCFLAMGIWMALRWLLAFWW